MATRFDPFEGIDLGSSPETRLDELGRMCDQMDAMEAEASAEVIFEGGEAAWERYESALVARRIANHAFLSEFLAFPDLPGKTETVWEYETADGVFEMA